MKSISKNCDSPKQTQILDNIEGKYNIKIREDIKEFLLVNSGGYPLKNTIVVESEEYEIRVFLSLEETNKNYFIEKPLDYFLSNTSAKIVPIAIDSGDNYYCVNNETGKVYYCTVSDNKYYCITSSLKQFTSCFK